VGVVEVASPALVGHALAAAQVSVAGSVSVDRLMEIERYSHVMHISSTVTGQLLPDLGVWDVLRAALPAGTVSGAPKARSPRVWFIKLLARITRMPGIQLYDHRIAPDSSSPTHPSLKVVMWSPQIQQATCAATPCVLLRQQVQSPDSSVTVVIMPTANLVVCTA